MKLLLALPLVFFTATAQAEGFTPKDIPEGEDVIVYVKQGTPAPFNGQFFDINTSMRWANWLVQYKEHVAIEGIRQKSICASELAFQEDIAAIELNRLEVLNADLTVRLKRSETGRLELKYKIDNPPWYESSVFWFALGAVTVGGFGIAAAQAF